MNVSPELQQQLVSVVQELGVSIPPPVGIWLQTPTLVSFLPLVLILLMVSACRCQRLRVSASGEDGDV